MTKHYSRCFHTYHDKKFFARSKTNRIAPEEFFRHSTPQNWCSRNKIITWTFDKAIDEVDEDRKSRR